MPDPGYPWEVKFVQMGGDGVSWELVYHNSQTGQTLTVVIPKQYWAQYGITEASTCTYMKGWAKADIDKAMLAMWGKPAGSCGGIASADDDDDSPKLPKLSNTWLVLGGLVVSLVVFSFVSGGGKK